MAALMLPPDPTQHLDNAVLDDIRASHTEIQTGIDTEGLNCVYNASEEQTCLAGGGGGAYYSRPVE